MLLIDVILIMTYTLERFAVPTVIGHECIH